MAERTPFFIAAAGFARPNNAVAYGANTLIANNTVAASVTGNATAIPDTIGAPVSIEEILLNTNDLAAVVNIRLHLFNADPALNSGIVNGDGGAFSVKRGGWIGSFSGTLLAFADGARGRLLPDGANNVPIVNVPDVNTKNFYWLLQALGGFTPTALTTFAPTFRGYHARS